MNKNIKIIHVVTASSSLDELDDPEEMDARLDSWCGSYDASARFVLGLQQRRRIAIAFPETATSKEHRCRDHRN